MAKPLSFFTVQNTVDSNVVWLFSDDSTDFYTASHFQGNTFSAQLIIIFFKFYWNW